jgi:histone H3/H4
VGKIITEVLSTNPSLGGTNGNSMSFAKETRDLLIECCVEFITMISAEANEIAEKEAKKTIASEHVTKALEELGFAEYVPELLRVVDQFKSQAAVSGCRNLILLILEGKSWNVWWLTSIKLAEP